MNDHKSTALPPVWAEHLNEATQWLGAYVEGSRGPEALRAFAATLLRLARLTDIATNAGAVKSFEAIATLAQALSGSSGPASEEGNHHLQIAFSSVPGRLAAMHQNTPFENGTSMPPKVLASALRVRNNDALLEHLEAGIPHQASQQLPPGDAGKSRLRQLRGYFQRSLTGWLRNPAGTAHTALMAQVLGELGQHTPIQEQGNLWWCGQSIAMALMAGQLRATPPLRRTLFRLDGELRALQQDQSPSQTTPALCHDLLFYCLLAGPANPRARALHQVLAAGVKTQQATPTRDTSTQEEVEIPEHLQADIDHARNLLRRIDGNTAESEAQFQDAPSSGHTDPESIPAYVDAEALRQFFDRAGEIKETQFRMEQQGGAVDNGLKRMEDTILTLKTQLERIEGPMEPHAEVIADKRHGRDPGGQLNASLSESMDTLRSAHDQLLDLKRDSNSLLDHQHQLGSELDQVLVRLRMLPFHHLLPTLREFVAEQVARHPGKALELSVLGEEVQLERSLLEPLEKLLKTLIASAISGGMERAEARSELSQEKTGYLHLVLTQEKAGLCIQLWDDGTTPDHPEILRRAVARGVLEAEDKPSTEAILQCLSHPAMAREAPTFPRIKGLIESAHAAHALGGSLRLATNPGGGLKAIVTLGTQPSVGEVLLIELHDEAYAIRLNDIRGLTRISHEELEALAGHQPLQHVHQERSYRCVELRHALGVPANDDTTTPHSRPALLVEGINGPRAILVDRIHGRRQALVQPIAPPLNTLPLLAGSTISEQGRVIFVLDLEALDPPRLPAGESDTSNHPAPP